MHGTGVLLAIAMLGVAAGTGAFTFVYADGASYLRDDAVACANCHVMGEHFAAWQRGSHRSAAVCNDCHAPHGSWVAKYAVKAINGFNHSWAFTTGDFHDTFRLTPLNRRVTEAACRHCHGRVVRAIDESHSGGDGETLSCIRCHEEVGHP
jgi:cytochrome c nitrite reductase small subunit